MSVVVRDAATNAAKQADLPSMDFHSGAVHDSMQVAAVTQAGMLLAPSRDGISHSPREWTAWSECADPTRGLAGTLAELAEAR
jgi:N-carbamoyl-L-amino-acid hydrolase